MLPLGVIEPSPGRYAAAFLSRSEIHGGDDMAAGGTPVVVGALPAPLASAGAAVEAEVHIVNAARFTAGDFVPV